MKRDQVAVSLEKAVVALSAITDDDLRELSITDCARMVYVLPQVPEIGEVRRRLARRLQRQLSVSWVEQGNAYEVFAVLIALWQYKPACVTGEHLAATLRRLIAAERVVGGPYDFKNVDTVPINAQVALFMRLVAKPLPNVDAFLAQAIDDGQFGDSRLNRVGLLHLLVQAGMTPKLVAYIKSCWTGKLWQTPLGIATALIVLNDSISPRQRRDALAVLCSQQHQGLWAGSALAASTQNATFVTTAIVVGVLKGQQAQAKARASRFRKRQQVIVGAACQIFASYTEPLRSSAIDMVTKVGAADKNFEITQLSVLFAHALKTPDTLTAQQHTSLGLASFFGWMAYTIYDDFLDSEGEPEKLPVANIAMRTSIDYFRAALPAHAAFVRYAAKIFCVMDEANAWEVGNCRFVVCGSKIEIGKLPRYGQRANLASRSIAHTLAPMAVLWQQAPTGKSADKHHIKAAFTHYLIARQLSDDLHDWVDDVKAGQASYVVTAILRDIRAKPGTYSVKRLLPTMQKSFRRTVLPKVCQYILRHVVASRQEFIKSELLHTDNNFYSLLDRLEVVARYSLDMRAKSFDFYKASKGHRLE